MMDSINIDMYVYLFILNLVKTSSRQRATKRVILFDIYV